MSLMNKYNNPPEEEVNTIEPIEAEEVKPQHPVVPQVHHPTTVDYEAELNRYMIFEKAKEAVLKPTDYIKFRDNKGNEKNGLVKSGLYKLKRLAKISVEPVSIRYFDGGPEHGFCVEYRCVATEPDGTRTPGTGVAAEKEFQGKQLSLHNRVATAETRAIARAIGGALAPDERLADDLAEDEIPVAGKGGGSSPSPKAQTVTDGSAQPSSEKKQLMCQCPPSQTILGDDDNCESCGGYFVPAKLKYMKQKAEQAKEK